MKNTLRGFIFFCSGALMFAQPALRLKVHAHETGEAQDRASRIVRRPPNARIHVIVQFDDPPSAETLASLTARGVAVLQDVPDNAVLVAMDAMVPLDNLGIRLATQLDPAEKISPLITAADVSQASEYYLVEFHPDVEPNAARRLLLSSQVEMLENPDLARNQFLIHVPNGLRAGTLISLAVQDPIAYIFPASDDLVERLQTFPCGGALTTNGILGQYVATSGDGWDGPGLNDTALFYFFSQMTAQMASGAPQAEVLRAMAEWSDVIQLHWLPGSSVSAARTVNIQFAQGEHGDGFPFDGPGNVLAHTFYPAPPNAEPLAGDMHFDDSESWRIGANIDLFSVALHELGHALGLGHSDDPRSVMYPYYKMVSTLTDDDKSAIETMYATRSVILPPPAPLALTVSVPPATTTLAIVSLAGTVTGGSGAASVAWSSSTGASGAASVTGTTWMVANTPLAVGLNSIAITAADATGTVSSNVSITREISVPPPSAIAITVTLPPSTTTSSNIALSGTVTGGSTPAVTWSASTGASGAAVLTGPNWLAANIPLVVGLNSITVTASDASGGSVSRTVSVTRQTVVTPPPPPGTDTTGPTLLITYPSSSSFATTLTSLKFTGTASDRSGIASVTWSTNTGSSGTASGTTSWIAVIPLLVGSNTVIIRSTDTAGNMSWKSVVVARR